MNKQFIITTLGLFLGFAVNAQSSLSDNVTLNVNLHPIQSITVNTSQQTVNLDYKLKSDYSDGVKLEQKDHLEVYSTGGFQIFVKADGSELTNSAASTYGNISANDITIETTNGTEQIDDATYVGLVKLSEGDQSILTATSGAVDKTVSITYGAAGGNTYVDKYIASSSPTTYTTQLTYTITAQ